MAAILLDLYKNVSWKTFNEISITFALIRGKDRGIVGERFDTYDSQALER